MRLPDTYISPAETGFYYLQARYYDPETERFINADSYLSTGQNFLGYNAFAYCGNNPVNGVDADGEFWDTILDLFSLGASVIDVFVTPTDIWAWASLGGDVIDVLIPFVGGIGETTRALSTVANVADGLHDTAKSIDIAQLATTGTPNQIGKIGEKLAGINPKAKISIEVNGRTRIPDALTPTELIEVKNVKYISNTQQLRDFATYAKGDGRNLELILYVRPNTKIASTVKKAGWTIKTLWD